MGRSKKFGFYRKSKGSNKRLVVLFERNQKVRYGASNKDWEDKNFLRRLTKEEKSARREILKMLEKGAICASDDFYRAAWFFHHGKGFRSYALAVALAAASHHLGEPWAKNFYAVALDRFLLSIRQPQYFGTQLERRRGKWMVSPYNRKTTDNERRKYSVEPLKKTLGRIRELEEREEIKEK